MSLFLAWLRCALVALPAVLLGAGAAMAGDRNALRGQDPAALYHNYCSVCHGEQGDGNSRARGSLNPAPRDFTTAAALHELTRPRMVAAVKGGVPGTAMAAWGTQLSDAQIAAVVDYVRDTFMRASSQADASRGRQIYARSCSVCHGDRGAGSVWASANLRPAPRDFTAPSARTELTRERMLAAVAGGRPGTAMTGFATQLQPDEIAAVVDYIRGAFLRTDANNGISGTLAHGGTLPGTRAAAPATAPAPLPALDMSLPLPHGLVGRAEAGQRFYEANCATCHGRLGDGQGPRAYFINPKPRNFLATRGQFNRPALYAAVAAGKLGTEMPAWDKVLERQQIADVSEYVFQRFVQAGAAKVAERR